MSIPKEVEPILERLYAGALTSDAASELGRQLQAALTADDATIDVPESTMVPEVRPVPEPDFMKMPDTHNGG